MNLIEACGLQILEDLDPTNVGEDRAPNEEYEALSKSLGYGLADSNGFPLARFMQRHEIPAYNKSKVEGWLANKAENVERVVWLPMRAQDKGKYEHSTVYAEPIPLQVLRLADKFKTKFGDKVEFRIGCLQYMPKGDPFLQVKHTESDEEFIVAHWDEPGFSIL